MTSITSISSSLEQTVKEILQIIRGSKPSEDDLVTFVRPVLGEHGFKKIEKKIEIYYTKFVNHKKNQFKKTPSYNKTVAEISTYIDKHFLKKLASKENLVDELILQFIINYLRDARSFKFQKIIFNKIFKSFNNEILPFLDQIIFFVPIHNLKGNFDEIHLLNDLKIRKITVKEYSKVADLKKTTSDIFGGLNEYPNRFLFNLQYVLEGKIKTPNNITETLIEIKAQCEDIVSIMKLFKHGDLQTGAIYYQLIKNWEYDPIKRMGDENPQISEHKFTLNKNESRKFIQFFTKLRTVDLNAKNRKFLKLSLKRFSRAISEKDFEDKIIDFCIALESLYHKPDDRTELTYRISAGAAVLLGNNDERRLHYFSLIKDCYSIRSSIIHTGLIKKMKIDGKERDKDFVIDNLESATRQSILRFISICLDDQKNHKLILKDIDEAVLNESTRRILQKNCRKIII